jgi:GrpB-like predicted nucleotidyltransferase (UPF0157 family)
VVEGGPFWTDHLLFRDYLRAHPHVADEYYRLKRRLAGQYGIDRYGYTDAKSPFISSVMEAAVRWKNDAR